MDYRKKIVKECVNQNKLLKQKKLTIQTFSNVSIRLNDNYFTIKPSGVSPEKIIWYHSVFSYYVYLYA